MRDKLIENVQQTELPVSRVNRDYMAKNQLSENQNLYNYKQSESSYVELLELARKTPYYKRNLPKVIKKFYKIKYI